MMATAREVAYCDTCELDEDAVTLFRLTATTLDGEILDTKHLCRDCMPLVVTLGAEADQ